MALRLIAVLLLACGLAAAGDRPIGGRTLLLRDPAGEPARRAFKFKTSRDPGVDPTTAVDPRTAGATVEVIGHGPGDGSSGVFPLEATAWKGLGSPAGASGYKWAYRGLDRAIRKVYFKTGGTGGTLSIAARGVPWTYALASPQTGPITVRFTIGTDTWCARFDPSTFQLNAGGQVRAARAVVPSGCDLCGDHILGPTEECDDGNLTSGDGCSATCTLEPFPCIGDLCMPVVVTTETAGVLPNGQGVLAKDLAVNVSNGTTIRYFFGDTLGLFNDDGTIATNSGAEAPVATPLETTNFPTAQVVPFTPEEAQWNLEGPSQHPDRWGIPPAGAVLEGTSDTRLFYTVDQPVFSNPIENAFYTFFPSRRLGTAVLPSTETVLVRDVPGELPIADNEWATGFHRLPDGSVRFYVLETSDFDPLFPVRRALWTATDGFQIESTTLFELDAVGGFSVFWNTSMEQWLAAWVDSTGAVRLSTLTEDGTLLASPPSFVYQIPNWNHPWKGYLAVHIDGADTNGGRTLLLLYSRMINTFSSDMPVVRVTIAGP